MPTPEKSLPEAGRGLAPEQELNELRTLERRLNDERPTHSRSPPLIVTFAGPAQADPSAHAQDYARMGTYIAVEDMENDNRFLRNAFWSMHL